MYNRDIGQKKLIKRLDEEYHAPSRSVRNFNNVFGGILFTIFLGALAYNNIFKEINNSNQILQPTSVVEDRRRNLDSLARETERNWDIFQDKQYKKWREQSEKYPYNNF